ncbi:MAG: RnfABCDGE type electron transport complex subunit B [Desulfatitalea sp.]|nr:RnfABCDGE type electron transport complex subunit B [Desulfatitalea sp.]NNJ98856.1 RnfABCDGE type electron transport complex subunit B [Desulfatitalea sp.]
MIEVTIGLAGATMLAMALIVSYILGWANKKFAVEIDPRVEAVIEALPGANCGGCGFLGCSDYAVAVVADGADVNKCPVGGDACAAAVAEIMGVEAGASLPFRPIVHCGARLQDRLGRTEYRGESRCASANLVSDVQGCTYGCLGFGDCARICNYDAIHVIDGLAVVDYDKCIGCGACARVCPRNIITITAFRSERIMAVGCANKDKGKDVMAVCKVGCIGCKACSRKSNLITIQDNLSVIDYDQYSDECLPDLMKACDKCPRHRLVFVGKPSPKEQAAASEQPAVEVVAPDFKTTVDDTEWRG